MTKKCNPGVGAVPVNVIMIVLQIGAIKVLRNTDGGGGCLIFWEKALRRCNVQCY